MSRPIVFGHIPNIEEGKWFKGRKEMMLSSFHRNWGSGIDGNKNEGVSAIVLSGGYVDDKDLGDEIIYTCAGGNQGGKQIEDQTWKKTQNAGLLKSMNQGLPVRVIRGFKHKSEFSPIEGYVYAGLYSIVDAWEEKGQNGYKICRFRLIYSDTNSSRREAEKIELDYVNKEKGRRETTILRIIRDTKISQSIKQLYNFQCQVCMTTLKVKNTRYAEGAHIKPLGKPHNGDDNPNNIVCLCPNHHVLFDKGSFSISDSYDIIGDITGKLNIHRDHILNIDNLKYHRESHGYE